jgi:hypothetical protein
MMAQTKDQIFETMLNERAKRLNISVEEAARVDNEKPLSLIAAESGPSARGKLLMSCCNVTTIDSEIRVIRR